MNLILLFQDPALPCQPLPSQAMRPPGAQSPMLFLPAFFSGLRGRQLCYDIVVRLRRYSSRPERLNKLDFRSEKNLAVAILRQAWHEAILDLGGVKETSREDHRLLKKKAIEWIGSDEEGFPYWCKLADVDHKAVRKELLHAIGPPATGAPRA